MKEIVARCRDVLVARLGLVEEELRLAETRYKKREGDFREVFLENLAVFERQVHDIARLKSLFQETDLEQFQTLDQFKEFVLTRLGELYERRHILRSAVRIIMDCVREL